MCYNIDHSYISLDRILKSYYLSLGISLDNSNYIIVFPLGKGKAHEYFISYRSFIYLIFDPCIIHSNSNHKI